MDGQNAIPTGWVDILKGDEENLNVGSCWVALETKRSCIPGPDDMAADFAVSPPQEALRFLFHLFMPYVNRRQGEENVMVFGGMSCTLPQ